MSIQSILQQRKQYNKENSKFISLEQGESFTGVFQDADEFEDIRFGKRVGLKFRVNGMDKVYNRPATGPTYKLLNEMIALGIGAGDTVKLTRLVSAEKASLYKIEKLGTENGPLEEVKINDQQKENELEEIDRIFKK